MYYQPSPKPLDSGGVELEVSALQSADTICWGRESGLIGSEDGIKVRLLIIDRKGIFARESEDRVYVRLNGRVLVAPVGSKEPSVAEDMPETGRMAAPFVWHDHQPNQTRVSWQD